MRQGHYCLRVVRSFVDGLCVCVCVRASPENFVSTSIYFTDSKRNGENFKVAARRRIIIMIFSRPYWVILSRLWYDVLSVCRLSVVCL